MKKHLALLLFLLAPAVLLAQEEDGRLARYEEFLSKCESKEETIYNKNHKSVPFQPLSVEEVKHYKNEFFRYERIEDYNPYDDSLYKLPYEDYRIPYQDSVLHTESNSWYESTPQCIGKVDKRNILRYEKKGQIEAFVFEENRFLCLMGLWVAYSSDDGNTWEYYYTGIMQKKPLFAKWYSRVPLINDDGDVQIEACFFVQENRFGPWGWEYFDLAEDGLLLTFDLETLKKDTDGDGLTDIVEALFRTNPNDKDTDGDGITDDLDMNPRFALPRTDKTIVFEAILNEDERLNCPRWETDTCELIPLDEVTPIHYATDSMQTIMVVTDDPNLLSVQPALCRIIFVTSKELAAKRRCFADELYGYNITPLFKADELDDTWIFSMSSRIGGVWKSGYYAKKTKQGWEIGMTYSIIE